MYRTSRNSIRAGPLLTPAIDGDAARARWLVDESCGGAAGGKIGSIAIEPNGRASLKSRRGGEQALFVVEGTAMALAGGIRTTIGFGDTLYLPGGQSVDLCAENRGMQLLLVDRGSADAEFDVAADIATAQESTAVETQILRLDAVENVPFHKPELGFLNMAARWLISAETVRSGSLIVGQSTFAPGGAHLLHRHDRVEEFFFLLEGGGVQLVEGGELPVGAGDVVFVPQNEWHGFRNTREQPAIAVFGYFGANRVEAGGYEVHDSVDLLTRRSARPATP